VSHQSSQSLRLRTAGGHSHDARAFRITDNKLAENIPNGTTAYSRPLAHPLRSQSELTGLSIFLRPLPTLAV
jgi:hypothetical protein